MGTHVGGDEIWCKFLWYLAGWWFQIFVYSYLGKWSYLTNIFQMGWNHQLVTFGRWLITMVSFRALTGAMWVPFQMAVSWLVNGGYQLLTSPGMMILQVFGGGIRVDEQILLRIFAAIFFGLAIFHDSWKGWLVLGANSHPFPNGTFPKVATF